MDPAEIADIAITGGPLGKYPADKLNELGENLSSKWPENIEQPVLRSLTEIVGRGFSIPVYMAAGTIRVLVMAAVLSTELGASGGMVKGFGHMVNWTGAQNAGDSMIRAAKYPWKWGATGARLAVDVSAEAMSRALKLVTPN